MSQTTYSTYEDEDGACIVCVRCKYHSRGAFDVREKHCPSCRAYHAEDGKLLMRNTEAEAGYRALWIQWCLTSNPDAKNAAERCMEGLQSSLGRSPKDPRYYWFVRTLPGFLDFWDDFRKRRGC